jgi:hypothetical protein
MDLIDTPVILISQIATMTALPLKRGQHASRSAWSRRSPRDRHVLLGYETKRTA